MSTAVVLDSNCGLTKEEAKAYGIYILPMPFMIDGKEYLDFVAGIAVNALGYGDEQLSAALKRVIDGGLLHCSNLYWNPYAVSAARLLKSVSGMDKVFFCNSGAEANEAALKLARKFGHSDGGNRTGIITMEHSFHGRTYGAITATGQDKYHKAQISTYF